MSKLARSNGSGCPGPSYQDIIRTDSTPVAEVLALNENPVEDTREIPYHHYTSQAFFDIEMDRMWSRTWQFVCREEHIPEVGDYWVYDIGDYSIIVVRTEDGLRGYHNSCLHRGTKLKPSGTSGWTEKLACPFHGWTWELDGTLNEVPCAWEFEYLDYAANRLPQVQVETWNSFVLINMDPAAPPLLDYLEVVPEHFAKRDFSGWYTFLHIQKELNCNWKVAMESFMEAYHTPVVHPELTQVVGDWNMQHDVFGDHVSRDLCPMGVSSPSSSVRMTEQEMIDRMFVGDGQTARGGRLVVPEGKTARVVLAEQYRDRMARDYGLDLTHLSDAEVIDSLKYNIFPNAMLNASPVQSQMTLFRPEGSDPNRCIMENLRFRPVKPGEPRPEPAQIIRIKEHELFADVPGIDPFVGKVYDQDTQIMRWQQEGMRASRKGAASLSTYQESRIRRVHETLAKYVGPDAAGMG
jgi:phenylpropionate dioxygenase-like ring-hydroxylating dioxygenase large terminal subunit